MKLRQYLLLLAFVMPMSLVGCDASYSEWNRQLIRQINSQMLSGNYTAIYDEVSDQGRQYKYSREEMIARFEIITNKLRKTDASLQMNEHFGHADPSAFPISRYDYRYVEGEGKRIGINLTLKEFIVGRRLVDLCIYTEIDGENVNPPADEFCLTDASKS